METTWIIALSSPILLTIGGIISWIIKSKREETIEREGKARQYQLDIYKELLEPYIIGFTMTLSDEEKQKGIQKILTLDYRKAAFNLMSFGSDKVVLSFNTLMQTFYHMDEKLKSDNPKEKTVVLLRPFADLMLSIRQDLYKKGTKLTRSQMIEFMITDIEDYRKQMDK